MQNKNSTFYLVSGIIGMIYGILTCIFLIGIPFIIGASKYLAWAKMSDEEMAPNKDAVTIWGIVFAIFMFPLGLLALFPIFNFDGQLTNATNSNQTATHSSDGMDAKMEKIKKLYELKEKGILDEEDFKLAKEKILKE